MVDTTSVGGIGTLTPFGVLVPDPDLDFPADFELLATDTTHVYQLTSGGAVSRYDTAGVNTPLPALAPPAGQTWSEMATDPTTGIVFAASTDCATSSRLFTVVLTAGTSVSIGTITNSTCIIGLAFNNAGSLFGYDIVNDSLLSINKVTGAGAIVGPLGFNANFGQAMDCDPTSGTCFLFAFNATTFQPELRSVNLTTGASTLVGVIGATSPGGTLQVAGAVFGTIGSCTTNGDCNDGNACNGVETCVANQCAPGTPLNCDDGLFCTVDGCTPATGTCTHAPNTCDDGDGCTADSCDNTNGCTHVAGCVEFCNTANITINDAAPATPYPSSINVLGLGTSADVGQVRLQGIAHTFPDDIDILLVGPGGQNAIIMSDAGGGTAASGVNLSLSDAAALPIPDNGPLVSGSFKPTNVGAGDVFAAPAPAPSGGSALSVFNGTNPNGSWRLFVVDDAGIDTGNVAGGWCVSFRVNSCTTNADCSDGNLCNGVETCVNTQCQPGTPQNCDDGLFCTIDGCTPATGVCTHAPNTCDDGDGCTADVCSNTSGCSHSAACVSFCNTASIAINDSATPPTTATPYPSAINVAAFSTVASVGSVRLMGIGHTFPDDIDVLLVSPGGQNAIIMSDAGGSADVTGINLTLTDGAAASIADGGPLVSGTFKPTNFEVGDTFPAPAPAPAGGSALSVFNGTNPNGAWRLFIVDDANIDSGTVTGGWCLDLRASCSTPADCDDGNPCTTDTCDTVAGCQHTPNTATCDDGNGCTTNDQCSGGSCVGGPPPNCDDGNPCTTDSCSPTAGGCIHPNNSNPCSDGNACTTNDQCSGGSCVGGPPPNCDDGNGCTDDSCTAAAGCVHGNNSNPCNDGNACTTNDQCSGGSCVGGSPPNCDDGNPCTTDSCTAAAGCVHSNNTNPCNDGNACTTNDQCSGGSCVGGPPPNCDDGNPCTTDSCTAAAGCVHSNNTNPCNDGNACTTNDQCSGGSCVGGSAPNCDDGNPCTDDTCTPEVGCAHSNNSNSCNDGSSCTTGDHCAGGSCVGTPLDCNDDNVCTTDSCNPASGCVHACNGDCGTNPKGWNYWKHVCDQNGGPQHAGDAINQNDVNCVNDTCSFAGVSNPAQLCAYLSPNPNNDGCKQAEREFMALMLNICRCRVTGTSPIHSECTTNTTVAQSRADADAIICSPARTHTTCNRAHCESQEINNGDALEVNSLKVQIVQGGAIKLTWAPPYTTTESAHVSGYKIWRRNGALDASTPYVLIGTVNGNTLTFIDSTAMNASYQYEISMQY